MYIARQLSFSGVTFDIREVSLTEKFIEMYDSSVEMVRVCYNHRSSMNTSATVCGLYYYSWCVHKQFISGFWPPQTETTHIASHIVGIHYVIWTLLLCVCVVINK